MTTALTATQKGHLDRKLTEIRTEWPHWRRGQQALLTIGRLLEEIRSLRLYSTYGSLDALCEHELGLEFSGSRASQLADAYIVYRTLVASRPDGERSVDSLTFIKDFNEAHARAIKHLPPEQQVQAWEQASEEAKATGQRLSARLLARYAQQFQISPEEIDAMTTEQQQQLFGDMEAAIREAANLDYAVEASKLAVKRNRKVVTDLSNPNLQKYFAAGEYQVQGGILGLARLLMQECTRVREELESPLWIEHEVKPE